MKKPTKNTVKKVVKGAAAGVAIGALGAGTAYHAVTTDWE